LASLPSWLYGVAYRLSLKCRAAGERRRRKERPFVEHAHTTGDGLARRELRAGLDEELTRLPEQQRAPLLLCYAEGKSQEQAARELGWSRGTLRRRLERGRDILRRRLTRRGFGLGIGAAAGLAPSDLLAAVPPGLAAKTVRIGWLAAVDPAAALPASAAAALAGGTAKAVGLTKAKLVAALLALVLFATGAGAFLLQGPEGVSGNPGGAQPPGDTPAAEKPARRLDLAGDPLPAGALLRLGSVRFRGDKLAFSADGKVLATTQAHFVLLLDVATGKKIRRFAGGSYRVQAFALSADGKRLATGERNIVHGGPPVRAGEQNTVCVWDTTSGKELGRLKGDLGEITSLKFSPDGRQVAVGGDRPFAGSYHTLLWDVSSGRRLWQVGLPEGGASVGLSCRLFPER
jgi:hypothetical protein